MAHVISSSPLASAFRCCQFDLDLNGAQNTTATELSDLLLNLRDYNSADALNKPLFMKAALKALLQLSKIFQGATLRVRDLSLNPKVHRCYDDGVQLVHLIKESTTAQTMSQAAQKIASLAIDFLPPNGPILETLASQAKTQQSSMILMDLCSGLCGLYEIAALRPHLSQRGATAPFLAHIARLLTGLMGGFAEVGANAQTRNEGVELLRQLAALLKTHRDTLEDLYEPNTAVARLVSRLAALSQPEFETLYDPIRNAAIAACYDRLITPQHSAVTAEHVTALFKEQAQALASALPDHLKPDYSPLDQLEFAPAHNGALLAGNLRAPGGLDPGNVVGDIPGSDGKTYLNASNPMGVDNKIVEQFQKITAARVYTFYQLHQLPTTIYTATNETLIATEIEDPIQQARTAVIIMVDYEIEQHATQQGLLFGLEPAQREALKPEKTIQVVVFGIQHDMFSPFQILALLQTIPYLNGAPAIKQALKAAVIRFTEKAESAEELQRLMILLQAIPIFNGDLDRNEINQALNTAGLRLQERERYVEEASRFPNADEEFARFGNLPYNEDV